ncbi:rhodanese-related sulfurtransferase [Terriglobus roseus DSM 18391]|uniref:Sulfurtransferase n=1 Tax=Terriglobus roseus (strain DSM 18391 / NRRL B-41598 / KBS 63) TaxID=926566 RepID=I3ZEE7_TERRK|nr:3-mercaptopyruvate sulfurtransferase [Terriglobus roseus]AFL87615.1 rhodanese-related sulfurtransferase [Terriglobus roseus DSM 18391]
MSALVSPQWVASRLSSPDLVIVDATMPPVGVVPKVDTHALYLQKHLPGAVFFDIDALSDHSSGLPHTIMSDEAFGAAMGELGIHDTATIVVYEQGDVFSAPRARWKLRAMGAKNVHLLDGGLKAWEAAGLPLESGPVVRERTKFHATLDKAAVKDYHQIRATLAAGEQVLDARSEGRFTGAHPEPRAGLSSGHMQGATSMPFPHLANGASMKSPEELRAIFEARGVDLQQPITTSCGSGVTAAVVALALEMAGAPKVTLYDGSWAEYASRAESVIVKDV